MLDQKQQEAMAAHHGMHQSFYETGRTRVVCPATVGSPVLETLRHHFIDTAGGCTETLASGHWHAYENGRYEAEPVHIFDVAGLSPGALYLAASMILHAGQTDVYAELPDGRVTWFNRQEPMLVA